MGCSKHLKTQVALARISGVPQATVGRIIRGEVDPQAGNLQRLARALRMPLAALARMAEDAEMQTGPVIESKLLGGDAMRLTEEIDRALRQALERRKDSKRGEQSLVGLRRQENDAIERLQLLVQAKESEKTGGGAPGGES